MDEDTRQSTPQVVGFRLSQHYADELLTKAQAAGLSPHSYARNCVIHELENNTAELLGDLRQEIRSLRADFQSAINPNR